MSKNMLPRDLKPGMKIARINDKIETEFIEIGRIMPVWVYGRVGAYKIFSTRWLSEEKAEISRHQSMKYLAPFTVTSRQKLEVEL